MEIWKKIQGYNGWYEVSSMGSVRSITRRVKFRNSTTLKHGKLITLMYKPNVSKYLVVELSNNGKRSIKSVHRLVALAFIPNPKNKPEVNHRNGNRFENSTSNLQWVTRKENAQHAYDNGLQTAKKGEKSHFAKLTNSDAERIRAGYEIGYEAKELANKFKVTPTTIYRILRNETFSD